MDDKYQYTMDNKDSQLHGWISPKEKIGFWHISPSQEFRSGGPSKQDLTSHTSPVILSVSFFFFISILFSVGEL